MKRISVLILICFNCHTYAQYNEHFFDGDFTQNPMWTGTDSHFIINTNHALQLTNISDSNITAYLSTYSPAIINGFWKCTIKTIGTFKGKSTIRFYLCSNRTNLTQPLKGYYIQIIPAQQSIDLIEQNNSTHNTLIHKTISKPWLPTDSIQLICTRAEDGQWQLLAQMPHEPYAQLIGQHQNLTHLSSEYSGIVIKNYDNTTIPITLDNFHVEGQPGCISTETTTRNQVVFSELMIDPTPTVGLPNTEYIELYNRTDHIITLHGWKIFGNSTEYLIDKGTIAPNNYILFCSNKAATWLYPYGNVATLSTIPSLTNDGKLLYLTDTTGQVITWVEYDETWFSDNTFKRDGGWAIERRDCNNLNHNRENWDFSQDPSGGTPGRKNSIDTILIDTIRPRLLYFTIPTDDSIQLIFNKELLAHEIDIISNSTPQHIQYTLEEPKHASIAIHLDRPLHPEIPIKLKHQNIMCISQHALPDTTIQITKPTQPRPNAILINEILCDIPTDGTKFIELYNRSQHSISLSQLQLTNQENGQLTEAINIADQAIICPAKQYVLLTPNLHRLYTQYHYKHQGPHLQTKLCNMPKTDGSIVLTDKSGTIIDLLSYNADMHHPAVTNTEGVSLERIDANKPTSQSDNWTSAETSQNRATPGYQNSQHLDTRPHTKKKAFKLSTEQFTPNADGYQDYITLFYTLPQAGYTLHIKIFDPNGLYITALSNNNICGTEGSINWDGTTQTGYPCPIGIYIFWIQATHPNSHTLTEKLICVISAI